LAAASAAAMRGDAAVLEEDLDDGGGEPHDPLVQELVGDAVVVVLDCDVIVDVDASVGPLGKLVVFKLLLNGTPVEVASG